MPTKRNILEWTILPEDERDWEGYLQSTPNPQAALSRTGWRKWQWWSVMTVLLVLVGGSAFILWYQAREGIAKIESELSETVKLQTWMELTAGNVAANTLDEQTPKNWQRIVQNEQARLPLAFDERATVTVADLVFDQDFAAVQIVLSATSESTAYRQTRFYRSTDAGWLRTTPNIAFWGAPHRLETNYFVFEFHQRDAQAVTAVAAQIDTLYTTMLTNFGLPVTSAGPKFRIEVSVTEIPGIIPARADTQASFRIPSPALYLAPVGLTDADLLTQALALLLTERIAIRAVQYYTVQQEWPPMLDGLRLWQLWNLDLPLSVWQDEVVSWIYSDVYAVNYGQPLPRPRHYEELCATHQMWMESPRQINIPLDCDDTDGSDLWLTEWSPALASMHPIRWGMPFGGAEQLSTMYGMEHPGKTVALATVFEYAVITYGQAQLPALIAGLGTYDGWETLLPAVLGVSAADFEAGWRGYLAQQYNVSLDY